MSTEGDRPKRGLDEEKPVPVDRETETGEPIEPQPEERRGAGRDHQEELIDESLQETFPASDPPSIALPDDSTTR